MYFVCELREGDLNPPHAEPGQSTEHTARSQLTQTAEDRADVTRETTEPEPSLRTSPPGPPRERDGASRAVRTRRWRYYPHYTLHIFLRAALRARHTRAKPPHNAQGPGAPPGQGLGARTRRRVSVRYLAPRLVWAAGAARSARHSCIMSAR